MKNYQKHLPSGLLVAYIIYSGFVPVSIAHSLIVLSLAALCGYRIHISHQEKHQVQINSLEKLKNELETKMELQKELYGKKLLKLEDELGKLALNHIPPKPISSSPQPRKMVF